MSVALILDILSWGFVLSGSAFVLIGCIGLLRFPDFYTRLHAAGITDTAGAELILIGMALQAPTWLIAVKIGFIMVFLFLTSPVATHAVAQSAWVSRLAPMTGSDLSYQNNPHTENDDE